MIDPSFEAAVDWIDARLKVDARKVSYDALLNALKLLGMADEVHIRPDFDEAGAECGATLELVIEAQEDGCYDHHDLTNFDDPEVAEFWYDAFSMFAALVSREATQ